jgi:DNA-binding IclR family transcriptional regulator
MARARTPASGARQNYQIKALDRTMQLLDCFTRERPELGVSELSRMVGMHKATVHRILMALEQHGLMEQDPATEKYRLGLRLLELGARVNERLHLPRLARPELERLVALTGETAHLVVMDQEEGLYLEKVESPRPFRVPSQVGRRLPLHCTGVGKAILAFLEPGQRHRVLGAKGLARFTPRTITEPQALETELQRIRERGYSMDDEEVEIGLRCIGAPVFDHQGQVVGAISIAGPAGRITPAEVSGLAESVKSCAAAISARLGYHAADGVVASEAS